MNQLPPLHWLWGWSISEFFMNIRGDIHVWVLLPVSTNPFINLLSVSTTPMINNFTGDTFFYLNISACVHKLKKALAKLSLPGGSWFMKKNGKSKISCPCLFNGLGRLIPSTPDEQDPSCVSLRMTPSKKIVQKVRFFSFSVVKFLLPSRQIFCVGIPCMRFPLKGIKREECFSDDEQLCFLYLP